MAEYQVINKSYPQIDALSKVSGKRAYISDIRMPGLLWGHVVRSNCPHAKIEKIDISKARKLPGVKAVITAEDTPRIACGPFVPDWEILAGDTIRYEGQPVAAIAAVDAETAASAARLVEVEYEALPAVFDPEEALIPGAPQVHKGAERNIANTFKAETGDVDAAFKESDYIREEIFYPSTQFHATIEPNGGIASYDPLNGKYTLWATVQVPYKAWLLYSQALGVRQDQLRLIQAPMGGGFGGKFVSMIHLIAACLSKKTEKPVRLVNTFEEEFLSAPLRVPMKISLKMGIKKNGTLTAKEVEVIADNGAYTHWGPVVLSTACYRVDNLYRINHTRSKGYLVYTNNLPKGSFRGFGQPQMLFAAEAILDMLAEDTGIDPGELRLRNTFQNGEKTVHGWVIGSCGLPECIQQAQEQSDWNEKRARFKTQTGNIRRGIGLACCNHVSGVRIIPEFDGSAAMVKIGPDARITVYSGEVDMGQGYTTVAAQIAAEELGVPVGWVEVAPVDSQASILGVGSLASRATLMGGSAVKLASARAREKLLTAAASFLGKESATLAILNGNVVESTSGKIIAPFKQLIPSLTNVQAGQPFVGVGHYDPGTAYADPETKYGNLSPAYPFGAHVAEVEVDLETGMVRLTNYVAANDVGKAINPLLVKGQLEGGIAQGLGYALSENLVLHEGKVIYKTLVDYKIPTIVDMPDIIPLIIEEEDANGPYGAKSVGEAAIDPVVAAICNAIYNAVGVRITRLPVMAETLLEAIKD